MFYGCPERGEQNDISPHKTAERFLYAVGVYGDSFHSNSLRVGRVVGDTDPYGCGAWGCGAGGRGRTPPLRMDRGCGMYWRRGEGTPPYGGGTRSAVGAGRRGRRPLRVHNKWCVGCRRQGEGTPPYGGISRGAVKRVVEDADPYESIAGSAVRGEYGLPHQRARWFAMTYYFGAARGRRGRWDGKFF